MKNNNETSYIIILGVIILCVFTYVVAVNIMSNNNSSNSYYSKVDEEMTAKIEEVLYIDNKLVIKTSNDAKRICIKTTRTIPKEKSSCWKNINNNETIFSIYTYKKYYIWIMDDNKNVSVPFEYSYIK